MSKAQCQDARIDELFEKAFIEGYEKLCFIVSSKEVIDKSIVGRSAFKLLEQEEYSLVRRLCSMLFNKDIYTTNRF